MKKEKNFNYQNHLLGVLSGLISALFFYIFWRWFIFTLLPESNYLYLAWLPWYKFLSAYSFYKTTFLTILLSVLFFYGLYGFSFSVYLEHRSEASIYTKLFIIFISTPLFSFGSNISWIIFLSLIKFFGFNPEGANRTMMIIIVMLLIYLAAKFAYQSYNRINQQKKEVRIKRRSITTGSNSTKQKTIASNHKNDVPVEKEAKVGLGVDTKEVIKAHLGIEAQARAKDKIKKADCPSLRLFVAKGFTYEDAYKTLNEIKDFLADEIPPRLKRELEMVYLRYLTLNEAKNNKPSKLSAQLEIKALDGTVSSPLLRIHKVIDKWKIHKVLYGEEIINQRWE